MVCRVVSERKASAKVSVLRLRPRIVRNCRCHPKEEFWVG